MLTSLYCQIPFLKPFQCRWTHPLLAHSNSPLKYVFWNIFGTSYLPLHLSYTDNQALKHNLVLFGGNRQVCAHCGEIVLCHRRCSSCSRCYLGVHQHEQRGAGRQEYLSPPKCVWKDKKANKSKCAKYQCFKR